MHFATSWRSPSHPAGTLHVLHIFLCSVYAPVCTILEEPLLPCRYTSISYSALSTPLFAPSWRNPSHPAGTPPHLPLHCLRPCLYHPGGTPPTLQVHLHIVLCTVHAPVCTILEEPLPPCRYRYTSTFSSALSTPLFAPSPSHPEGTPPNVFSLGSVSSLCCYFCC